MANFGFARPAGADRPPPAGRARRRTAPGAEWPLAAPGLALQLARPCRRRHARPARWPRPAGALALHPGATRRPRCGCRSCSASRRRGRRAGDSGGRRARTTAGARRRPSSRPPPSTWVLLRLWPLCQAVPQAAARRLPADAGLDRRDAGAALPDHAADGRRPDPVPERAADRIRQGRAVPGRAAGRGAGRLGAGLGHAPTCWRWCRSASAPTCAPPPTNTC